MPGNNMWMFDTGSGDGFQREVRKTGYIIIAHRDGSIYYCTRAWTEKDTGMHLSFSSGGTILCFPHIFDTHNEATAWLKGWQRSFPATASEYDAEIRHYEC